MKIAPFKVEEWMNAYEAGCTTNIAETCADSVSLRELFALTGTDEAAFWEKAATTRLTYGYIEGNPAFLSGIASLYRTVGPEHIVPTHGAAGANHLALSSLVSPGDEVVAVTPTYQQLYSIPESLGATVKTLSLTRENNYKLDLDQLDSLVTDKTRLICINNPNNPTGALLTGAELRAIADIAAKHNTYILSDEAYRHLTQGDEYSESLVDIYDKALSISTMSKAFSLAGLRLGWIVTKDQKLRKEILSHRDYCVISCSLLDELAAGIALAHADKLLARNRAIVRKNLAILDSWVAAEPRVSYIKPQAGTTSLLYLDIPMSAPEFCRNLLAETGTLLTPGDCFYIPGSVRIGYACAEEELIRGLTFVHDFLAKL